MKRIISFHHFKGECLPRPAEIERRVVSMIAESKVPDSARENSIVWEFKHSSGAVQAARLLAQRRGLDPEIAAMALALHDIYAIETGAYRDHARLGAPIAERVLRELSGVTPETIELVVRMVDQHSEKHVVTTDPYVELAKDADCLDCFLYPDAEDFYLTAKPIGIVREYFLRYARIRAELNLPRYPRYDCLSGFASGWLKYRDVVTPAALASTLWDMFRTPYDPLAEAPAPAAFRCVAAGIQVFSTKPLPTSAPPGTDRCASLVRELVNAGPGSLLVCWPAFNAYEILSPEGAVRRLLAVGADVDENNLDSVPR